MTLSGSGSDNTQFIPSFDAFEDYSIQAHSNSGAHSPIKQDANKQESAEVVNFLYRIISNYSNLLAVKHSIPPFIYTMIGSPF